MGAQTYQVHELILGHMHPWPLAAPLNNTHAHTQCHVMHHIIYRTLIHAHTSMSLVPSTVLHMDTSGRIHTQNIVSFVYKV